MNAATTLAATLPAPATDGFAALRARARHQFIERGLPDRRDEAYKYSDLGALGREAWPRATPGAPLPALPPALGHRALWLDGALVENGAADRVVSLADLSTAPPRELIERLGSLAREDDPVVALNTALFDHGAWIAVPENEEIGDPIELAFASGARNTSAATHARISLRLGAGSRLTLIERRLGGDGAPSLSSRIAEIVLEAGSELTHLRLNEAGGEATLLGCNHVRLDAGAHYRHLSLDLGAKFSRESLNVVLQGPNGATELAGLALLDGRRHADSHVTVEHVGTGTRSRQYFRGVLDGRSRGIYSGLVHVHPGAQKSDSAQESANLLLSRHAEADVRPQLEIYADDVACTHGSAIGAIEPDSLFYLQSRGIGEDRARRMIAYGFAARVLAVIENVELRRRLAGLLAEHLDVPAEVKEWL